MHNNTVHTHMIEIITKQKNEMMTITFQYEFAWKLLIYSINLIHTTGFCIISQEQNLITQEQNAPNCCLY